MVLIVHDYVGSFPITGGNDEVKVLESSRTRICFLFLMHVYLRAVL